jgi:hypothetical protein
LLAEVGKENEVQTTRKRDSNKMIINSNDGVMSGHNGWNSSTDMPRLPLRQLKGNKKSIKGNNNNNEVEGTVEALLLLKAGKHCCFSRSSV